MKKNIIGALSVMITLALALWGCGKGSGHTVTARDHRKPIISIAELMIDKLASSSDTTGKVTRGIRKLRHLDSQLFKALLDSPNTISTRYFYSRRGSCCPCSPGGTTCCRCSGGSALGVASGAITKAKQIDEVGSVFMLAKMSVQAPADSTLQLSLEILDGMKIFTVPANTKAGTYKVSFKGKLYRLDFRDRN